MALSAEVRSNSAASAIILRAFGPVPTPQKHGSQKRVRFWYPIVRDDPKPRWKPMMSALDSRTKSGKDNRRQSTSIQNTFLLGNRSHTDCKNGTFWRHMSAQS